MRFNLGLTWGPKAHWATADLGSYLFVKLLCCFVASVSRPDPQAAKSACWYTVPVVCGIKEEKKIRGAMQTPPKGWAPLQFPRSHRKADSTTARFGSPRALKRAWTKTRTNLWQASKNNLSSFQISAHMRRTIPFLYIGTGKTKDHIKRKICHLRQPESEGVHCNKFPSASDM